MQMTDVGCGGGGASCGGGETLHPDIVPLVIHRAMLRHGVHVAFLLGCVSRGWAEICNELIVSNHRVTKYISDRFFRHFYRDESLVLERYHRITEEGLRGYMNLTSLTSQSPYIRDEVVRSLTKLTFLDLHGNPFISNGGVSTLTNLTHLNLSSTEDITNDSVSLLTNLTALKLDMNCGVTDAGIRGLTKLKSFSFEYGKITEAGIRDLTNIEELDLVSSTISTRFLVKFTRLTALNLAYNSVVHDDVIGLFPKLVSLDLRCGPVAPNILATLTNLTTLKLAKNNEVGDECLRKLVNLTSIYLRVISSVSDEGLKGLTKLTTAELLDMAISDESLSRLTNLTWLRLERCPRVTGFCFRHLTRLAFLAPIRVSDEGIIPCAANLTALKILAGGGELTDAGLSRLTSLRSLTLHSYGSVDVTDESLSKLTNLTVLDIYRNDKLTVASLNSLRSLTELTVEEVRQWGTELRLLTNITCLRSSESFEFF